MENGKEGNFKINWTVEFPEMIQRNIDYCFCKGRYWSDSANYVFSDFFRIFWPLKLNYLFSTSAGISLILSTIFLWTFRNITKDIQRGKLVCFCKCRHFSDSVNNISLISSNISWDIQREIGLFLQLEVRCWLLPGGAHNHSSSTYPVLSHLIEEEEKYIGKCHLPECLLVVAHMFVRVCF